VKPSSTSDRGRNRNLSAHSLVMPKTKAKARRVPGRINLGFSSVMMDGSLMMTARPSPSYDYQRRRHAQVDGQCAPLWAMTVEGNWLPGSLETIRAQGRRPGTGLDHRRANNWLHRPEQPPTIRQAHALDARGDCHRHPVHALQISRAKPTATSWRSNASKKEITRRIPNTHVSHAPAACRRSLLAIFPVRRLTERTYGVLGGRNPKRQSSSAVRRKSNIDTDNRLAMTAGCASFCLETRKVRPPTAHQTGRASRQGRLCKQRLHRVRMRSQGPKKTGQ